MTNRSPAPKLLPAMSRPISPTTSRNRQRGTTASSTKRAASNPTQVAGITSETATTTRKYPLVVAFHEAGHVVAHIVEGLSFDHVLVRHKSDLRTPHIDQRGREVLCSGFMESPEQFELASAGLIAKHASTHDRLKLFKIDRPKMEASIRTTLAGPIAEGIYTHRALRRLYAGVGSADWKYAIDAAKFYESNLIARAVLIGGLESQAQLIVWTHWRAIEIVARELARVGLIDFDRCLELAAIPWQDFWARKITPKIAPGAVVV